MDSMNSMTIPTSAREITVEWLTSMLPLAGVRSVTAHRIAEDRGFTGEIFLAEAELAEGRKSLVIKTPRPDHWERSLREIRLLETVTLPIHTSRIISSEVEVSTRRSALVLSHVKGEHGNAAAGATPVQLDTLVHDLAVLHAGFRTSEALEKLRWLPNWGQGTAGGPRPHQRRSDRYRSLIGPFLAAHAQGTPSWVSSLLREIAAHLEDRLAELARLPQTLIHADAHLDNIIFRKETAYWLDWQSASLGPGLYDLTRLLSETVDVTTDLPLARRLVHAYASHLSWHGVDEEAAGHEISHLPAMAAAVLVGFVSGYGGRPRATLAARERLIVDRAVSEGGLFGFVRHVLSV